MCNECGYIITHTRCKYLLTGDVNSIQQWNESQSPPRKLDPFLGRFGIGRD